MKLNLMPVPAQIKLSDGTYKIDENFSIQIRGETSDRILSNAARLMERLSGRTGMTFKQNYLSFENDVTLPGLILEYDRIGCLRLFEDESYHLNISTKNILLKAQTDIGVLRGMETLLQLFSSDDTGYFFPAICVKDEPRFPWRGLMIDVCRHFMPVDVIKRNLDGMAAVKMNIMHLHLTDDQGFRIECKTFPKLHELGSDGYYYTQEQIKEIIKYADNRGIRVVPEFDIPGHATSWLVALPELASAPGPYQIERTWGIKNPVFNPVTEKTYQFFSRFFEEMAGLFQDEYMHIGGDENNGVHWNSNDEITDFMSKNGMTSILELQNYFNKRILEITSSYNKKLMGWDEILQPGLPKSVVIQSWRGHDFLTESAQKGYYTILSNGYYLDLNHSTEFHYLNDPVPADSSLTPEEQKYILGGEAAMWGEVVTAEIIDSRIWPRNAAIAERLWSQATIRDVDDMYRRLEKMSFQLEELGLLHKKNQFMMLKRLVNNRDITLLKVLVDVLEPVKDYLEYRPDHLTQQSPMTRTVYATEPDSTTARKFKKMVDDYLSMPNQQTGDIEDLLIQWAENHTKLSPIIAVSPILKEIEPLSKNLSEIAKTGLHILEYVKQQKPAEKPSIIKEWQSRIEKAKQPYAQAEIIIVSAIEKLANKLK